MRPLHLLLLLATLASCTPLHVARVERHEALLARPADCSAACAPARRKARLWGGVREVSLYLAGGTGLAQLAPFAREDGARAGLAVGTLVAAAAQKLATHLVDGYAAEVEDCCPRAGVDGHPMP